MKKLALMMFAVILVSGCTHFVHSDKGDAYTQGLKNASAGLAAKNIVFFTAENIKQLITIDQEFKNTPQGRELSVSVAGLQEDVAPAGIQTSSSQQRSRGAYVAPRQVGLFTYNAKLEVGDAILENKDVKIITSYSQLQRLLSSFSKVRQGRIYVDVVGAEDEGRTQFLKGEIMNELFIEGFNISSSKENADYIFSVVPLQDGMVSKHTVFIFCFHSYKGVTNLKVELKEARTNEAIINYQIKTTAKEKDVRMGVN